MYREATEIEISLLESDLQEISDRLYVLTENDAEIRDELLKNQKMIINDLEICNRRLKEELKWERRLRKLAEF